MFPDSDVASGIYMCIGPVVTHPGMLTGLWLRQKRQFIWSYILFGTVPWRRYWICFIFRLLHDPNFSSTIMICRLAFEFHTKCNWKLIFLLCCRVLTFPVINIESNLQLYNTCATGSEATHFPQCPISERPFCHTKRHVPSFRSGQ